MDDKFTSVFLEFCQDMLAPDPESGECHYYFNRTYLCIAFRVWCNDKGYGEGLKGDILLNHLRKYLEEKFRGFNYYEGLNEYFFDLAFDEDSPDDVHKKKNKDLALQMAQAARIQLMRDFVRKYSTKKSGK